MKRKTAALLAVLAVGASVALVACSSAKAYASQCVYIIQNGYLDAKHIDEILHPGEKADTNDKTTRYIYCNARNYLVRPGGDYDLNDPSNFPPLVGQTKENPDGTPGNPMAVQLSVYWQLNQNDDVLTKFLPYCEKFTCFSDEGTGGSDRNSTPGWNSMLKETFAPALNRAVRSSLNQFNGNLDLDQSKWPALADKISLAFMEEVKVSDGSGDDDFFCSSGSEQVGEDLGSGYNCAPVRVTVDNVTVANAKARDVRDQTTTLDAEKQLADKQKVVNEAELKAAKAKYGEFAEYFLALQDTIAKCAEAGQNCTVVLGGSGNPNVNVRP